MTIDRIARHRCSRLALVATVLTTFGAAPTTAPSSLYEVTAVPDGKRARMQLSPFYQQFCATEGFPIVASAAVNPFALKEAAFLIDHMLAPRPELRRAMNESGVHCTVMAVTEMTTDVPEHSELTPKEYWDRRARSLGATPEAPCVSCGEENLLGLGGDPYATENILIHEFAHAIHETGLSRVDPTFDARLTEAFDRAIADGLWAKTYAATNRHEYWAEGTQSWFNCNRANDNVHNDIDTREKIKQYDPRLAALLAEAYGDGAWRDSKPVTRPDSPHLAGFDLARTPAFTWPTTSPTTRASN